nr:hypothetical protein [uncultured Capnocytophaga sp.]
MAQCVSVLSKDLTFDCDDKVKGIEKRILLINRADIDFAATVVDAAKNKITSLVLKSGKTGYFFDNFKETHINESIKPEISDDDFNGYKHSIGITAYGKSAEDYEQIDQLVNGADLVGVIEHKAKGVSSFDVLGFYTGLVVTEGEGRTNGGAFKLTISTPSNQREPNVALKWLETDYATTKKKFDKKLAA